MMNIFYPTKPYHALLDFNSGTILTISQEMSELVLLNKLTPDTTIGSCINFPHYMSFRGRIFFEILLKLKDYPEWSWDYKKRKLTKKIKNSLSDDFLAKSLLMDSKRKFIGKTIFNLNLVRKNLLSGVSSQSAVYAMKKEQAQAFKNSGFNEDLIMQFPYVMQYADFAHTSLKQAAEDILLKAKFDDDILYKTEFLRLKYFDKIKKAAAPEQLPPIFEEFILDCFVNAQI